MNLKLFRSLWTVDGSLTQAIDDCSTVLFEGIEGPVPLARDERQKFLAELRDSDLPIIAEITTGGGYVPDPGTSPLQHLDDFRRKADAAMEASPLFFTMLAGRDAWPVSQAIEFFGSAMEIAAEHGVVASFETHRSRALFSPWGTVEILRQLPEMKITCDFSHWCCVCERLVLEEEPEILALCAQRVHHFHARVGYDQGAQVPHPAAPSHARELAAHTRWWRALWDAQESAGIACCTATPEFGPDGYLHCEPFTGMPVANLGEVNRWMAVHLRQTFKQRRLGVAA